MSAAVWRLRNRFVTVASSLTFLICSVAATSIPAAQMTQMLMTALWGSDCIGIARSWWGGREAPARLRRWIASAHPTNSIVDDHLPDPLDAPRFIEISSGSTTTCSGGAFWLSTELSTMCTSACS